MKHIIPRDSRRSARHQSQANLLLVPGIQGWSTRGLSTRRFANEARQIHASAVRLQCAQMQSAGVVGREEEERSLAGTHFPRDVL